MSADDLSRAIEEAVTRFGALLRGSVARHGLSPDEVDEAAQQMRIRLWRALGDSESIATVSASYLYRAATTAVLDLVRSRRRRRETPLDEEGPAPIPAAATADRAVLSADFAATLDEAIESIVPSRRAVVRMHLAGYAREEISELLGWTDAKTRNLLYRGLAELREELTRRGITPGAGT